jgi:hypothetical protein
MALSRLARSGELQRVGKGVYYHPVPTAFGLSLPAASTTQAQVLTSALHPSGLTAANLLGFSPQNPLRPEYATPSLGAPRILRDAIVHTGRPLQRAGLPSEEGAILEILRDRARASDLSPAQTVDRLLRLLGDERRYRRLVASAVHEPPRVRAMLGALGEELEMPLPLRQRLRRTLSPLSQFDFGSLRVLRHARAWQAK